MAFGSAFITGSCRLCPHRHCLWVVVLLPWLSVFPFFATIKTVLSTTSRDFRMKEAAVRLRFDNVVQRFRVNQGKPGPSAESFCKVRASTSFYEFGGVKPFVLQVAEGRNGRSLGPK